MKLSGAGPLWAFVRSATKLRHGRSWKFSHARDLNASEDRTSLALWGVWGGCQFRFYSFLIKDPGKPRASNDWVRFDLGVIIVPRLAVHPTLSVGRKSNLVYCQSPHTHWATSWRRQNFFRSIFKSLVIVLSSAFLCFSVIAFLFFLLALSLHSFDVLPRFLSFLSLSFVYRVFLWFFWTYCPVSFRFSFVWPFVSIMLIFWAGSAFASLLSLCRDDIKKPSTMPIFILHGHTTCVLFLPSCLVTGHSKHSLRLFSCSFHRSLPGSIWYAVYTVEERRGNSVTISLKAASHAPIINKLCIDVTINLILIAGICFRFPRPGRWTSRFGCWKNLTISLIYNI